MKFAILLALIALCAAQEQAPIPILRASSDFNEDFSYKFGFETGHGIKVEESGAQKQITPEDAGSVARGSYSYVEADGTVISVTWVADENGFQPKGAHLPVAPPTPDHVIQLLKDLKAAGKL